MDARSDDSVRRERVDGVQSNEAAPLADDGQGLDPARPAKRLANRRTVLPSASCEDVNTSIATNFGAR
jgi:hypothetical protein